MKNVRRARSSNYVLTPSIFNVEPLVRQEAILFILKYICASIVYLFSYAMKQATAQAVCLSTKEEATNIAG